MFCQTHSKIIHVLTNIVIFLPTAEGKYNLEEMIENVHADAKNRYTLLFSLPRDEKLITADVCMLML